MPEDKFERGILTKADREYLQSPDEYSRQASYNREQAIRERLQRAFNDFPPLAKKLDDSVLDDLLAPDRTVIEYDDGHGPVTDVGTQIQSEVLTLPYAVVFLIRAGLATSQIDQNPEFGVESALVPFRRDVERGIEIWLNEHHNLTGDVDVSIAVDDLQRADTLAEELTEQTEPLTGTERLETAAQLARAGYSNDEITDIVGERPLDESDEATDDVDDESGSDTA